MPHTPKPETIEGQTAKAVDPVTPCSALDEQRKALVKARRRIIARIEQVDGWLKNNDLPEDIRTNWEGMTEGLRQARRLIGGMWDEMPCARMVPLEDVKPLMMACSNLLGHLRKWQEFYGEHFADRDELPPAGEVRVMEFAESTLDAFMIKHPTPPTAEEEVQLRKIDEMISERLGYAVGSLRGEQNT